MKNFQMIGGLGHAIIARRISRFIADVAICHVPIWHCQFGVGIGIATLSGNSFIGVHVALISFGMLSQLRGAEGVG